MDDDEQLGVHAHQRVYTHNNNYIYSEDGEDDYYDEEDPEACKVIFKRFSANRR